jgi:guanylate kinase
MRVEKEKSGLLIVITGPSGTGKDAVANELLKHPSSSRLKRLVTCADRPPRPGEIHGIDYFFVTPGELDEMAASGKLVEKPQTTGTSRKGTPKSEFFAILGGEKRLWRIEPHRALDVATGNFFDEQFDPRQASVFKKITRVICITSPKEQVEGRRKMRDKENYNPEEYKLRDSQDEPSLKILLEKAILVENLDGQLSTAVEKIIDVTLKK